MKHVVLVLRHTPLNHIKNLEAFRLALGLTLSDNEVVVAMVDEGVLNAIPMEPEIVGRPGVASFLDFYGDVGIRLLADQASLDRYRVKHLREGVETIERKVITDIIRSYDVVIPF